MTDPTPLEAPNPVDLDELERVAKAATPGPWQVYLQHLDLSAPKQQAMAEFERLLDGQDGHDFYPVLPMLTDGKMCPAVTGCGPKSEANAAFIAAANPQTVLSLLAELRTLREAQRWIPTDGALPNNARSVLFVTDEGLIYWGCFEDFRWQAPEFEQHEKVVAWFEPPRALLALPNAPKGEL